MVPVPEFTAEEVLKHDKASDCYLIIEGNVYNVTKFLDEHPGGDEVMLEQAGQDSTEAYVEIGHSDDARGLLNSMLVGKLKVGEVVKKTESVVKAQAQSVTVTRANNNGALIALVPLVAIVAFLAYKMIL